MTGFCVRYGFRAVLLLHVAGLVAGCAHRKPCVSQSDCNAEAVCTGVVGKLACAPRCDPFSESPCPDGLGCYPQRIDPVESDWACVVVDS